MIPAFLFTSDSPFYEHPNRTAMTDFTTSIQTGYRREDGIKTWNVLDLSNFNSQLSRILRKGMSENNSKFREKCLNYRAIWEIKRKAKEGNTGPKIHTLTGVYWYFIPKLLSATRSSSKAVIEILWPQYLIWIPFKWTWTWYEQLLAIEEKGPRPRR